MKKFIASLTKGKEKLAMDEWKTDYSVILWALHSVHKKKSFSILVNFFKQWFVSSAKSYRYLKKFIS